MQYIQKLLPSNTIKGNGATTFTDNGTTTGLSVASINGPVSALISIGAITAGTGTNTLTLQHSDTQGGTYTNVGEGFNVVAGTANTYVILWTTESCKPFLRVSLSGVAGTTSIVVQSVYFIGNAKYGTTANGNQE